MLWHVDIGALTLHNRSLDKLQFPGGYVSFNADTIDGWHYYIQDYMGNVRMVVNSDGTVEQQNHYYPYGGIIGNLSTNQDLQAFKFEGKELDRKFGLDWYDIHARQYDAIGVPSWNKVDALAEIMPWISPYAYCKGNPINLIDIDGECPAWVVTVPLAAIGGAMISATISTLRGNSQKDILASAAGGFIAGAIAGTGVGLVAEMTTAGEAVAIELGLNIATGAISSGAGDVTEQFLSKGEIDLQQTQNAVSVGALIGSASTYFSKINPIRSTSVSRPSEAVQQSEIKKETAKLSSQQKNGMRLGSNKKGNGKLSQTDIEKKAAAIVKKRDSKELKEKQWELNALGTLDPFAQGVSYMCKDWLNQ